MTARNAGRGISRALLLAAFLGAAACRGVAPRFPGASVILVSVDTLRADHLPAYGYAGVATPALDALARDSVVFGDAVATVPLTLPSHAALFTGRLPFENGVRDNIGYRLDAKLPTIAGFLHEHGYATGGAVSAFVLGRATGIGRGFDFFDDSVEATSVGEALGRVRRSGRETERSLESWISSRQEGRPLFAFLHLYEPHAPYAPPEPYRSRYPGRPYDGAIAAADEIVGRFVAFLRQRGLYDRSVIVFLSDHGEGLGDHGEEEHGIFLYREAIHVPLFVKLPGGSPPRGRLDSAASLVDVFPTIAALLGERVPEGMSGESLFARGSGRGAGRRVYSETFYPRLHFGWSDLASLTDDRYQYIEAPEPELYEWREDPAEKRNLAPGTPAPFRSMRTDLARLPRPLQPPGAADPETVRRLASLGYLTGRVPAGDERTLPDPKRAIAVLENFRRASLLLGQDREDEAIALLREAARDHPRMREGWEELARVLRSAGRPGEAVEALLSASRLAPPNPPTLLGIADAALEAGDLDRARACAEGAAREGGRDAFEELASIALAAGDLAESRREIARALDANPDSRAARLIAARIETKAGDLAGALARVEQAEEIGRRRDAPPLQGLSAARGDVLARSGHVAGARAAFREEIESFPGNFDAWSKLAFLSAGLGDRDGCRRTLVEMTTRTPSRRSRLVAAEIARAVGDSAEAARWRRAAAAGTSRVPAR